VFSNDLGQDLNGFLSVSCLLPVLLFSLCFVILLAKFWCIHSKYLFWLSPVSQYLSVCLSVYLFLCSQLCFLSLVSPTVPLYCHLSVCCLSISLHVCLLQDTLFYALSVCFFSFFALIIIEFMNCVRALIIKQEVLIICD